MYGVRRLNLWELPQVFFCWSEGKIEPKWSASRLGNNFPSLNGPNRNNAGTVRPVNELEHVASNGGCVALGLQLISFRFISRELTTERAGCSRWWRWLWLLWQAVLTLCLSGENSDVWMGINTALVAADNGSTFDWLWPVTNMCLCVCARERKSV